MSIEVKGLKDLEEKLEKFQEGLTLHGLRIWAGKIEVESKGLAALRSTPEIKDSIHIDVIAIEPERFQIKADAKKEALPFVIEATSEEMLKMPITSRSIFKMFLSQLEKEQEAQK